MIKLPGCLPALLLTAAVSVSPGHASTTPTNNTLPPRLFRGSKAWRNANTTTTTLDQTTARTRTLSVVSSDDVRRTPFEVEVEGEATIPYDFGGNATFFGGISGVAYDDDRKVYYAITNDALNLTGTNITFNFSDYDRDSGSSFPDNGPDFDFDINIISSATESENPDNGGGRRGLQGDVVDFLSGLADNNADANTNAPTMAPTYVPPGLETRRPRFYTLKVRDGRPAELLGVTYLKDVHGVDYGIGEVVPQAIAYVDKRLIVSLDVGPNAGANTTAEIAAFNRTGHYQNSFEYPDYFELPEGGFTALTVDSEEETLYAATAKGLLQDDPNYVRIVEFDLETRRSGRQYVYEAEDRVVGMVSIDQNGGFVVLERSEAIPHYDPTHFTTMGVPPQTFDATTNSVSRKEPGWQGYDVNLYHALALDALNVESVHSLAEGVQLQTMRREHIYEWNNVTKFEAMGTDGDGPDRRSSRSRKSRKKHRRYSKSSRSGRQRQRQLSPPKTYEIDLILMSDNEFAPGVDTEVLLVELDLAETPVIKPEEQTADVVSQGSAAGRVAVDPAIWVHPDDSEKSLILGALSDQHIGVYGLQGNVKQELDTNGDVMGIDVLYGFRFGNSELIDLALVTDGSRRSIQAYMIRQNQDRDVLFGITEGMPTFDHPTTIATYQSPYTSKQYAFVVSGSNQNQIRQVELTDNNDRVGGKIVRTITLPNNDSNNQNNRVGGLVVDTELGFLYVSIQNDNQRGVLKYDAEPDGFEDDKNYPQTIVAGDEDYFSGKDIQGLALYYGDHGDGYLVASVAGDSTFVVLERESDNDYYDSFTIGVNRNKGIDETDNTQGIAITNVRLGDDEFECGLFVVQDFDNEETQIDSINNNGATQLVNTNTNFKLVPFEYLAKNLYYYLDIDTHSWNPRRFSLVVWINSLSQDVYSASLSQDRLSGRDTEKLLGYLNDAVRHIYPRSAKKQQMIQLDNPFDSRRRLAQQERRQETRRRILEDDFLSPREQRELKKDDCRRRRRLSVNVNDAKDDMQGFIEHLDRLRDANRVRDDDYNAWKNLARAIENSIPNEA